MRNKIILFVIVTLYCVNLSGQERTKAPPAPTKGKLAIEFGVSPFGGDGFFKTDHLSGRYWFGDNFVVRLGVELDNRNRKTEETNPGRGKTMLFGLTPGVEFRLLRSSTRISPYVGLQGYYRQRSSSYYHVDRERKTVVENACLEYKLVFVEEPWGFDPDRWNIGYFPVRYVPYYVDRAFYSFGAELFAGVDFYLVRNFYFGVEVAFGWDYTVSRAVKSTVEDDSSYSSHLVERNTQNSVTSFRANPLLKVGVWF